MRITTKFTLIISGLLLLLFVALAWASYRHDVEMALGESIDKARAIARQIIETRDYLASVVSVDQVAATYALTPQVAASRIAQRLTDSNNYYVRQVSLRYRNPDNRPDQFEHTALLQASTTRQERFQIQEANGAKLLRYLLPMEATKACLKCHGSYEAAPGFIQRRFPKGHHSYDYREGEIIGAISVSIPLAPLYRAILQDMRTELAFEGGILVVLLLVTGWLIHRAILSPVTKVAQGIEAVAHSGNYSEPIPQRGNDEIGRLVNAFNDLMAELERRTHQRSESDERYRNFIEIAQSPIVTFMCDGKIVIANQKAEALFGLSRSELLGQSIFDFMADPEPLHQGISDYFSAGSSPFFGATSRQTVRDICGRLFEVEMVISVSQTGQEAMFSAILRAAKP